MLACDWQTFGDEVMAAIAVHNIPEGIAIAMPVRS